MTDKAFLAQVAGLGFGLSLGALFTRAGIRASTVYYVGVLLIVISLVFAGILHALSPPMP